jgi:hypothetical protein
VGGSKLPFCWGLADWPIPLLGYGGVAARINKKSCEATFEARRRGGWFNVRLSVMEHITPSAPILRMLRDIFIGRRGHPSLATFRRKNDG